MCLVSYMVVKHCNAANQAVHFDGDEEVVEAGVFSVWGVAVVTRQPSGKLLPVLHSCFTVLHS